MLSEILALKCYKLFMYVHTDRGKGRSKTRVKEKEKERASTPTERGSKQKGIGTLSKYPCLFNETNTKIEIID